MRTPRFLLPTLALIPDVALAAVENPPGGTSPREVDRTISAIRGGAPGGGLSGNWYQYFCSPGTDAPVTTPCGMDGNGLRHRGCRNSSPGNTGAKLDVLSGDAGLDDVILIADGIESGALSDFLQGRWRSATGLPFGDGVRCATGPIKRLYAKPAPGA